jgi:integrase
VAETLAEVKGKLIPGPPKRAPAGEPSGCRPSSSVSWRHTLPPRSGRPCLHRPGGGLLRGPGLSGALWVPATKAAGPQALRIHDLRHTAVALWIAAGATPKEVAARAGPTSASFTLDRYGHQTILRPVAEGRWHPARD